MATKTSREARYYMRLPPAWPGVFDEMNGLIRRFYRPFRQPLRQPHPRPLHADSLLDGYVRVGSTNRRADRELIDELRRFTRGEAYDEQPMPGLDSEALDFRAASESFAPVRRFGGPICTLYG